MVRAHGGDDDGGGSTPSSWGPAPLRSQHATLLNHGLLLDLAPPKQPRVSSQTIWVINSTSTQGIHSCGGGGRGGTRGAARHRVPCLPSPGRSVPPAPSRHAAPAAIGSRPRRPVTAGSGDTGPGHTTTAGPALPSGPLRRCPHHPRPQPGLVSLVLQAPGTQLARHEVGAGTGCPGTTWSGQWLRVCRPQQQEPSLP